MDIIECFNLMVDIKKAQKDKTTPVGACYSMQYEYLKKDGIVSIGSLDRRSVLYATSETKEIPKEWCGFTVINTKELA